MHSEIVGCKIQDPKKQFWIKTSRLFHASQKIFSFEGFPSGSCFRCLPATEASSGIYSWQPVPLHQTYHRGLLPQHPKRQLSPQWRCHHSLWAAGEWIQRLLGTSCILQLKYKDMDCAFHIKSAAFLFSNYFTYFTSCTCFIYVMLKVGYTMKIISLIETLCSLFAAISFCRTVMRYLLCSPLLHCECMVWHCRVTLQVWLCWVKGSHTINVSL